MTKPQNRNYKILSQKPKLNYQKIFYGKNQDTIYVKLATNATFFDENDEEINPIKFENKRFNTNAVLKIELTAQSNDKNNIQIKLHDAVVKEPEKRKYVRKVVNKLF